FSSLSEVRKNILPEHYCDVNNPLLDGGVHPTTTRRPPNDNTSHRSGRLGSVTEQNPVTEQHTTLLVGGRIHATGAAGATAMAVTNDTIAWIGQDAVGHALHPNAEVIDLQGTFVTPAFVDPHVHATDTGLHLTGLDLTDVHTGHDLLAKVAEAATEAAAPDGILIAHGWDESAWQQPRLPRRARTIGV